ncbi:NAD dependent epimerase/dehydratase family-domain-containing protein [Lactarius deliciosus]|nr:NAD dependent epimerase/dehydratase family-domain-containing protein [Lactarius deliciosus]
MSPDIAFSFAPSTLAPMMSASTSASVLTTPRPPRTHAPGRIPSSASTPTYRSLPIQHDLTTPPAEHREDQAALVTTPAQWALLRRSFVDVKTEFTDLDGLVVERARIRTHIATCTRPGVNGEAGSIPASNGAAEPEETTVGFGAWMVEAGGACDGSTLVMCGEDRPLSLSEDEVDDVSKWKHIVEVRRGGRLSLWSSMSSGGVIGPSNRLRVRGQRKQDVILVTGGHGLVGNAIRHVLESEPPNTRYGRRDGETWVFASSREADLRNAEATKALFAKYKPTHVIHLAALVGGLFMNMKYKLSMLRDNININDNVLHTSHETGVRKVVSCLSTCVFPDGIEPPLREDKIHLGPPHESNFGYAHAKRLVDIANHAYKEEFGSNFTAAIPTNIYGPHDNFDLEDSHVIPGLIHKCYLAKKNGTPFTVAGTGKAAAPLREYDDVEPIIFSVGENEDEQIVEAFDFKGEVKFDTSKSDGQFRKPASNEKLLRLVRETSKDNEEFKFTPFEKGLKDSVDWFVKNYDNARIGQIKRGQVVSA